MAKITAKNVLKSVQSGLNDLLKQNPKVSKDEADFIAKEAAGRLKAGASPEYVAEFATKEGQKLVDAANVPSAFKLTGNPMLDAAGVKGALDVRGTEVQPKVDPKISTAPNPMIEAAAQANSIGNKIKRNAGGIAQSGMKLAFNHPTIAAGAGLVVGGHGTWMALKGIFSGKKVNEETGEIKRVPVGKRIGQVLLGAAEMTAGVIALRNGIGGMAAGKAGVATEFLQKNTQGLNGKLGWLDRVSYTPPAGGGLGK